MCDLACGSGQTAIELARDGKHVFAVDSAPRFCARVRAKARAEKLDVRVIRADMRRFRLPERVDGADVGEVTSGNFSPVLERGIALAFLRPDVEEGAGVEVEGRSGALRATVVSTPFVKKG